MRGSSRSSRRRGPSARRLSRSEGSWKEAALKESSWAQDPAMESMMALSVGPVPKNFPRADATLVDGEGGLSAPTKDAEGGEEEGEKAEAAVEDAEAAPEGEAETKTQDE